MLAAAPQHLRQVCSAANHQNRHTERPRHVALSTFGRGQEAPAGWRSKERQPVLQQLAASAVAGLLLLGGPASAFGPVSIKLSDVHVDKVDCATGVSTVTGVTFSGSSGRAVCLSVDAAAVNPTDKPLYNADVFGRVYDANGDAAIDATENIRIAYVEEVPAGSSRVHFGLNVPAEQYNLGPLTLEKFKITGFPGKMLPNQGSGLIGNTQDDEVCAITGDCVSEEDQIR